MTVERRAGAPRLIEWTGERYVPWTDDVQVAYEHNHRYLWAASLVAGRRVLDLGSGEGFGSAILAADAESVRGIDIDERAVVHSQLNYVAANLEFGVGSALELDGFADDSFDVVVAFEVIEHLAEQERMLDQIDRVLVPEGLLIVSTPDVRVYSDSIGRANPFHERELSEPEFRALLSTRFAHVSLWGQRTMCGSWLSALDRGAGERSLTMFLERSGDRWRQASEPVPMYLVAVASRAPFEMPGAVSTLADFGIELVRQRERETGIALADAGEARRDRDEARAALREARATVRKTQDEVRSLVSARERAGTRHKTELKALNVQLASAVQDVAQRDVALAAARSQLARVEGSVSWSAVQFVRWQFYRVLGEHSVAARSLQSLLRLIKRRRQHRRELQAATAQPPPVTQRIRFPRYDEPLVSIVISAYTGIALTEACLRAISANTDEPPYEVIIVDDVADADNRALWSGVEGAQVIINERNLGYLRSVNRAAAEARGRFIVLLNNDTEVQPGWLSALVERADSALDIGVVAPKLLFPDGTLQEAGAIIFRDGTGWNYGRGLDAQAPEFNYVREIDYGSGACLLVRADVWRELGGYDALFLPMYYEDTDLCFGTRKLGFRVVYEPAAHVVHVEGGSAGTDVTAGAKRHQELNRPKFVEKWRTELETEQPAVTPNVRRVSDRNRGRRVLVVDHRVPTPDRDSGSVRIFCMLSTLIDMGCRVTFLPDNRVRWEPYTRDVQELGVEVLYGDLDIPAEISSIGADLQLAIVSRPTIAARYFDVLREHAPAATIAYDTVDLHYLREERRAALGNGTGRKAATLREIELGLVRASDVTIVVTEDERAQLATDAPEARVAIIPNANALASHIPTPDDRSGILFVGGFEHTPNVDAAVFLVHAVMPLVWRDLGPVSVTIVGANAPPEVVELAAPAVNVAGWVPDLTPLLESARAMVAPLRYGAGMKGKVTQSLAVGLPVVTTTIGAQGLGAQDGHELLIADDAEGIAERIVRVYRDDELWRRISAAGFGVVERTCSPALMRERLEELLDVSRRGAAVVD